MGLPLYGQRANLPENAGIIERPRLLTKLEGAELYKLTIISAPPGYGKTTLVNQFARQTGIPLIWHTVDERDRDIPNLYTRCLGLIEAVVSGTSVLPLPFGYPGTELATIVGDFLYQKLSRPLFYVFDDVHLLTGSSEAEGWLRTFVTKAPANCHIILISRTLPDLPLVEMIARREVLAVGQEELRLTQDEIEQLAQNLPDFGVTRPKIAELSARLEGWPAGTALALYPLPAEIERAVLSGRQGPEALFGALATNMLDGQPDRIQSFLLASSTLERITPELCGDVLLLSDADALLREAQERRLFLSRTAGGLVYHALFREFLQSRLLERDPVRHSELHKRAARWFEQRNAVDEAFYHYYSAQLFDEAARLADQMAQSYFNQGRVETLLGWRAMLGTTSAPFTKLRYCCALLHTDRYEYDQAERELDSIGTAKKIQADDIGLVDIRLQRAMIQLQRGNYETTAAEVEALIVEIRLTGRTNGGANTPDEALYTRRALDILGTARLRLGESEAARDCLEEAVHLYRINADAYALSQVLQNLGAVYSKLGRLHDASACLQEVVDIRRRLGGAASLALALNNLGYYYHECNDYRQALVTLQEGLSIVARYPGKRAQTYLLWSLGDLQRDRGLFTVALDHYRKALDLVGNNEPPVRCSILTSLATLYRWQDNPKDAIALSAEASDLALLHELPLEHNLAQAALWSARAELGETDYALSNFEQIVHNLRQASAHFELVRILTLSAKAALAELDTETAHDYLKAAYQQAQRVGSTQPLVVELAQSAPLESLVNEAGPEYATLRNDLRGLREVRRHAAAEAAPAPAMRASATYSLRVFTLGQETIIRDGKPISPTEWRATSAKELFLYLLLVGPSSREQVSLMFWPNATPQRVRSNYHTTLYRARHALGEDVVKFEDGVYLINPQVEVYCDARELESLTVQARLLSPHDVRTDDLWRRAVDLYKGDFLPSSDLDWSLVWREASYERHLEALIGVGECARVRRDFKQSLDYLRRASKLEPYREDIHRSIMICYAQQGDKQRIEKHMTDLRKLLLDELHCEPAVETIALVQSLLR